MEMSHKFKKMRQGLKGTKQEVKEVLITSIDNKGCLNEQYNESILI